MSVCVTIEWPLCASDICRLAVRENSQVTLITQSSQHEIGLCTYLMVRISSGLKDVIEASACVPVLFRIEVLVMLSVEDRRLMARKRKTGGQYIEATKGVRASKSLLIKRLRYGCVVIESWRVGVGRRQRHDNEWGI